VTSKVEYFSIAIIASEMLVCVWAEEIVFREKSHLEGD
jgi:hypothetical protein